MKKGPAMPRKVEYVNAVEVARLTGLSEKTIRRKLDVRELEAEKRGNVYAIRVTDLMKLTLHKQSPDFLTTHIQTLEEQLKWQAEHISQLERRVQELERRLPRTVTRPLTPIPPRPIVLEKLDESSEPRSNDTALLQDSLQWHQQQAEQGWQLPTWARLPAWGVRGQVEERDQRALLPQQKERPRK